MRIFKVKGFTRFQRREKITDATLTKAVATVESGLIDADLGNGLVKQRVARVGQGKSGGFRTILAWRRGERMIFLLGFAKNERDNIDDDELDELRGLARVFLELSLTRLTELVAEGALMEVDHGTFE